MARSLCLLPAILASFWIACSGPAPAPAPRAASRPPESPRITQYYATKSSVAPGETALVCYGVENTESVWLEPPRHELSAAQARCVEVSPEKDTTYVLTARSPSGQSVTKELKIAAGGPPAHITAVTVSAPEVKPGQLVAVCYTVEHARVVTIAPGGFRSSAPSACASHQPTKTTTYVVTATGAAGEKDEERVKVLVR